MAAVAVIVLVAAIAGWIWYNGISSGEDRADAEAHKAEASAAREKAAALERARAEDNESARQKDVREATNASGRPDAALDLLVRSYEDDPHTN